jgi:hypothetical protein
VEPLIPEEALEYCLQNPDALTTEQLLAKFPHYARELAQLLALDQQLKGALPGAAPSISLDKVKARLLSSLAQSHKGTTPAADPDAEQTSVDSPLSQAGKRSAKPIATTSADPDAGG